MLGTIANGIRNRGVVRTLFYLLFLSLLIVGAFSALVLVALVLFGYFPLTGLISDILHFFYIHYTLIPVALMVILIIAIVVIYILALVMSYLVFKNLYSRV